VGSKAAWIKEDVQPGGIHVLKSNKIHEDQIANVTRDLKELYYTRRPDSQPPHCSGKGGGKQKNEKTGCAPRLRVRKTIWETGPVEEGMMDGKGHLVPKMETPGRTVTAIRCFRCGIDFPVADFLYTKKSGLCIDCWEEMVL